MKDVKLNSYRKHTDAQIERFIIEAKNIVGIFSAININDANMLVEVYLL